MDFSRRVFLKGLGLGGIAALTLPKNLNVIAATMADLKDPPVSAGYARYTLPKGFLMQSMHFMNCCNGAVVFQIVTAPNNAILLKFTSERGSADYDLRKPYYLPESVIEVWAAREGGRFIEKPLSCTIWGHPLIGGSTYSTGTAIALSARLNHVRLDRVKAIKMGLVDPSEPESDPIEDTGKLILET